MHKLDFVGKTVVCPLFSLVCPLFWISWEKPWSVPYFPCVPYFPWSVPYFGFRGKNRGLSPIFRKPWSVPYFAYANAIPDDAPFPVLMSFMMPTSCPWSAFSRLQLCISSSG